MDECSYLLDMLVEVVCVFVYLVYLCGYVVLELVFVEFVVMWVFGMFGGLLLVWMWCSVC